MFLLQEGDDKFQFLSERNRARQYDFLRTAFQVWEAHPNFSADRIFLCALNFYAVQYLSEQAGQYRIGQNVEVGKHNPPDHSRVEDEMGLFFKNLGRLWDRMSPTECAAYALWGVNHIHPFIDGNGRSSRALCYFVLCMKFGYWLPGSLTLPEQIRLTHRAEYCEILSRMDKSQDKNGIPDLSEMKALIERLLAEQLKTAA